MKTTINNVSIRYEEGEISSVVINFEIYDKNGKLISVTGHRSLTPEEYEGNESLIKLEEIVEDSFRKLGRDSEES